jgi:hypothetical protein
MAFISEVNDRLGTRFPSIGVVGLHGFVFGEGVGVVAGQVGLTVGDRKLLL